MAERVVNLNYQSTEVKEHQLHLAVVAMWFFFPLLSSVLICLLLYYVKFNQVVFKGYLFLLATIPALINSTKVPITDLDTYYSVFKDFNEHNISAIWANSVLDPFFYCVTFLLAKISNGYTPFFSIFWSIFIYYTLFLAQFEFNKLFVPYQKSTVAAIAFFTLFIGIEFGLTGHVVRQCAALSLIMYGIARLCRNKHDYKLFFCLAFLTHFSTIIFLPLLLFIKLPQKAILWVVGLLFVVFYFIGNSNLLEVLNIFSFNSNAALLGSILDRAEDYAGRNDGSVTTRMLAEVVLYFVICVFYFFKKQHANVYAEHIKKFTLLFIFFALYAFLIRNNNLLLLRYFFYFYFLSTFVVLIIMKDKGYTGVLMTILLLGSAPYRFFNGLKNSDFVYISNSYNLLLTNVYQFLIH